MRCPYNPTPAPKLRLKRETNHCPKCGGDGEIWSKPSDASPGGFFVNMTPCPLCNPTPAEPKRYLYHIEGCGGKVMDIYMTEAEHAEWVEADKELKRINKEEANPTPPEPKRYLYHTKGCGGKVFDNEVVDSGQLYMNYTCLTCGKSMNVKSSGEVMTEAEHAEWLVPRYHLTKDEWMEIWPENETIKEGGYIKYRGALSDKDIYRIKTAWEKTHELTFKFQGVSKMKIKKTVRFLMMAAFIRCTVEVLMLVHPLVIRIPWHLVAPGENKPVTSVGSWVALVLVSCAIIAALYVSVSTLKACYRWIFGGDK